MRGLAAVLAITGLVPIAPRSAVTTRYRVESKIENTVDLSVLGQPVQQSGFSVVSWIAVTLNDSAGGRSVHVVVDSMKYQGDVPLLSAATADSAKGGIVHGWVDLNGRVKDLTVQPQNILLSDIQSVIQTFFPKTKSGAKSGDAWNDTLEVTNTVNGAHIKSQVAIAYTAGSLETVGGTSALRVTAASSATLNGTMENAQAGTMEVSGTAKGSSQILLGLDGRYLGGQSSSTTEQQLKIAMAPSPIPVRTIRTVSVSWMP